MLAERLNQAWRARQSSVPIDATIKFKQEGLVLGAGTVLAPVSADGSGIWIEGGEARLIALLTAAHLKPVNVAALSHIRKAAEHWRNGQHGLAEVHLSLSRFERLERPDVASHRLFLADGLMQAGVEPVDILKALGVDAAQLEALIKTYDPNQPRVPKGSGRPSGRWANGAAGAGDGKRPPRPRVGSAAAGSRTKHPIALFDGQAAGRARFAPNPGLTGGSGEVLGSAAPRAWLAGLTGEQLVQLGLFAARFAGPAAALGVLFIPTNKSLRQEGKIPGSPVIQYLWHSDERSLALSYKLPNRSQITTIAELGEDGLFRDVDKQVIGRALPDGRLVIDRSAILPQQTRSAGEPTLCPAPVPDKDHKNINGLLFENQMKALVNPGNPTPSGYGVKLLNPQSGKFVYFDDCQRRSGILFEYKGNYFGILTAPFENNSMKDLIDQAERQVAAAQGDHIIWVFAEEDAMKLVQERFNKIAGLKNKIQFTDVPWARRSK